MNSNRVVIDKASVESFLKSKSVQDLILSSAEKISQKAGDGFSVELRVGSDRARAYVLAETRRAKILQARNHVLERAVGGGL